MPRKRKPKKMPSRWRQAGAVLAGLALLGVSTPASAQTLTWSVVPSPNPSVHQNYLQDVSCISATECTAVGEYRKIHPYETLVESWNGASWSVVPSPSPGTSSNYLDGVSCSSATACTAVGYDNSVGQVGTLVESWDGTSWSVVPSPSPGYDAQLDSVSCVSATMCTAVGYDSTESGGYPDATLIESWDGASWSVVPSPNPGPNDILSGVSCVSAANCTAVGHSAQAGTNAVLTLIESWDGTSWSVVPNPSPGGDSELYAVSCASATACMAVGANDHTTTVTESWNGTTWSTVLGHVGGNVSSVLDGVSCASATACAAVGYARVVDGRTSTLIKSWDGTSWTRVASHSPGSYAELYGVSCASASACAGTGFHRNSKGHLKTLVESGAAGG